MPQLIKEFVFKLWFDCTTTLILGGHQSFDIMKLIITHEINKYFLVHE